MALAVPKLQAALPEGLSSDPHQLTRWLVGR